MALDHPFRWTAYRKLELIEAIARGEISAQTACAEHRISPEELESWRQAYERNAHADTPRGRAAGLYQFARAA